VETNLEELAEKAENWIRANRRALFIFTSAVLLVWILSLMKEVTLLLVVSYLIAVLIEPAVERLTTKTFGRSGAIFLLMLTLVFAFLFLVFVILPPVIYQYAELINLLPQNAEQLAKRVKKLTSNLGVSKSVDVDVLVTWIRAKASTLGPESIGKAAAGLMGFLLRGYSVTLTILNLTLLPFFVFYISYDLKEIHQAIGDFFSPEGRTKYQQLSQEILAQVYAFSKGQIIVSLVMAVLYGVGLSLVDVPNGLAIGFLAGMLNIIPYLGTISGVFLSITSVLISDPTWSHIFLVLGVFVFVQSVEGLYLTPKVLGDKTGLHPMGVILALLIGGQLLGIFGLIIAIPAAAATKILFKFLWSEVKEARAKTIVHVDPV
jgi:predicted PurR-regulated permease PerM